LQKGKSKERPDEGDYERRIQRKESCEGHTIIPLSTGVPSLTTVGGVMEGEKESHGQLLIFGARVRKKRVYVKKIEMYLSTQQKTRGKKRKEGRGRGKRRESWTDKKIRFPDLLRIQSAGSQKGKTYSNSVCLAREREGEFSALRGRGKEAIRAIKESAKDGRTENKRRRKLTEC